MLTIIAGLISLISLPIWFYLLYWMLVHSGAGELQMFLFWVYVPLTFAAAGIGRVVANIGKKD
ncbi:MAG: hypothetical protein ACEQSH_00580 [Bacteroidia bacterium]